jgi:hypothetical protein
MTYGLGCQATTNISIYLGKGQSNVLSFGVKLIRNSALVEELHLWC